MQSEVRSFEDRPIEGLVLDFVLAESLGGAGDGDQGKQEGEGGCGPRPMHDGHGLLPGNLLVRGEYRVQSIEAWLRLGYKSCSNESSAGECGAIFGDVTKLDPLAHPG